MQPSHLTFTFLLVAPSSPTRPGGSRCSWSPALGVFLLCSVSAGACQRSQSSGPDRAPAKQIRLQFIQRREMAFSSLTSLPRSRGVRAAPSSPAGKRRKHVRLQPSTEMSHLQRSLCSFPPLPQSLRHPKTQLQRSIIQHGGKLSPSQALGQIPSPLALVNKPAGGSKTPSPESWASNPGGVEDKAACTHQGDFFAALISLFLMGEEKDQL